MNNTAFEHDEPTALVCVDEPDHQHLIVSQLSELGYKIHEGLFAEDVCVKLKTYTYDVVVIYENFNGSIIENNQVLVEAINMPMSQRRNQYFVLVGPSMISNNEMMAFIYSVDLVINISDLPHLKPALRRGVARQQEFYKSYRDCAKLAGK